MAVVGWPIAHHIRLRLRLRLHPLFPSTPLTETDPPAAASLALSLSFSCCRAFAFSFSPKQVEWRASLPLRRYAAWYEPYHTAPDSPFEARGSFKAYWLIATCASQPGQWFHTS